MRARTAAGCLILAGCTHTLVGKQVIPPTTAARVPTSGPPAASAPGPAPVLASAPVDFARDVRPILESRCQPCHFAGGKTYDQLPLDRPDTVRQLGPKLLVRIKDEPAQTTLRTFLAQSE